MTLKAGSGVDEPQTAAGLVIQPFQTVAEDILYGQGDQTAV